MALAIQSNSKLRGVYERNLLPEGRNAITEEVLESFRRVFFKTVRGLFFGLYGAVVPEDQLYLAVIDQCRSVSAEQVAEKFRPSPLEDITDKPFGEISPSSWHVREPIFMMDMVSVDGKCTPTKRVFRLKRETPIEWTTVQSGIFRFCFVKNMEAKSACVIELWQTLVIAVTTPWPADRGPMRKGRNNPLSRD